MKRIAILILLAVMTLASPTLLGSKPAIVAQDATSSEFQSHGLGSAEQQTVLSAANGGTMMSLVDDASVAPATNVHAEPLRAQESGTPAPLPPLLEQLLKAVDDRDIAAFMALYAEDASHEDVPAGILARGREEIQAYVEGVWGQFPDLTFDAIAGHQAGDLAWIEYRFSATDPESGQTFSIRGIVVMELEGELVRRSADYSDFTNVLVQIGQLVPVVDSPQASPAA
jgi:steroid delta-isomerase-like uncharacterized protein